MDMTLQRRIYEWGQRTFNKPSTGGTATRANIEMAELMDLIMQLQELKGRQPFITQQAFSLECNRLCVAIIEECADCVVVLAQVAHSVDGDLDAAVRAKVEVNEKRSWEKLEKGRYQHVEGT